MRSVKVAAALLCVPVVASCGSKVSSVAPTGTVTGEFVTVGGAQPEFGTVSPRPNHGTIALTGTTTNMTVSGVSGTDGKFSIKVPAGTYKASGSTPQIMGPNGPATCDALKPVTVAAGGTATVTIECIVP